MGVLDSDIDGMGTATGGDQVAPTLERIIPKKKRPPTAKERRRRRLAPVIARAQEMRLQGSTYKEIGEELDLCGPAVSKLIRETAPQVYEGRAAEYMELTMRRLEALLAKLWERAARGDADGLPDIEAIEQARKVMGDLRALTGIDAPKRQELTGKDGGAIEIAAAGERVDARIAAMAARLAAGASIQVTEVENNDLDKSSLDEGDEDEEPSLEEDLAALDEDDGGG